MPPRDGTAAGLTLHIAPRALLYLPLVGRLTWLAGAALLGVSSSSVTLSKATPPSHRRLARHDHALNVGHHLADQQTIPWLNRGRRREERHAGRAAHLPLNLICLCWRYFMAGAFLTAPRSAVTPRPLRRRRAAPAFALSSVAVALLHALAAFLRFERQRCLGSRSPRDADGSPVPRRAVAAVAIIRSDFRPS